MAILITNQPQNPPHNAYNNSIIEFGVDAGIPTAANISAGGHTFEIFPDLNGKFFFNLKSIVAALINENRFNDDIVVNDPAVFLYPDSNLFYELALNIEVLLEEGDPVTTDLNLPFLKSVEQVIRKRYNNSELKILTPAASQVAFLSYFEGMPFDISIYSDVARTVTIENVKTGMSHSLNFSKGVNRIFISNGENDNLGFENQLPLYLGVNELEFKIGGVIQFTLFLDKKEAECGKLLKWINPSGGWSYWRFMDLHLENVKTGTIDRLNRDFMNLPDSQGNISITGKEAETELQLMSGLANEDERQLLNTLLSSPKVYLYTNELHQPFEKGDFVEVELANGTFTKSSKNQLSNLTVKVILPNLYTQTL